MDSSNKVKDLNDTVIADTSDEDAPGSDFRKAVAYVYIGKYEGHLNFGGWGWEQGQGL